MVSYFFLTTLAAQCSLLLVSIYLVCHHPSLYFQLSCDILLINTLFFKLYLIAYAIPVVPVFPPLLLSTQPSPLPHIIPTLLSMSMGHAYMFFGYCVLYAVLYILVTCLLYTSDAADEERLV